MDTGIVTSVIASDAFQQLILNYLLPGMGSVLVGMLIFMGKKIAARYQVSTTADEWKHARDVFITGVRLAEEEAAIYFKGKGAKMSSNQKLNTAVSFIINELPKMDRGKVIMHTEATLAALDNMGATKKRIGYG